MYDVHQKCTSRSAEVNFSECMWRFGASLKTRANSTLPGSAVYVFTARTSSL